MIALALVAALAAAPVTRAQAERVAAAAADMRLADEARERGSQARVRLITSDARGWSFKGYATNPCLPGQAVCSDLLGHFTVDRTGAVRDADMDTGPDLRPLLAYVERRDECEHLAGEEGYDAQRRRELDRLIARYRCLTVDAERKRLQPRFTDPASRRVLRELNY